MIIEQITVRSFGLLRNYTESFSGGVNIIEGANETGKSTLAAFIRYMLYGFGEETGVLSERERRINWITGTADGSMTISATDRHWRIDRKTERVGNGSTATYVDECTVFDLDSNSPVHLHTSPGEAILGVGKDLYESTAFLGQMAEGAEDASTMRQSIENLMFSGDEKVNTGRAISALQEARDALLSEDGTQGRLMEMRTRARTYGRRLTAAVKGQAAILATKAKLDDATSRRNEAAGRYNSLEELKVCHQNNQILTSFEQLREMNAQAEDLASEAGAWVEANTYGNFFPDEAYAADVSLKRKIWSDSKKEYESEAANLRELEEKQLFGREVHKNLQRADRHGGEAHVMARYKTTYGRFRTALILALVLSLMFVGSTTGFTAFYFSHDPGGAGFVLWLIACIALLASGVTFVLLSINRHEGVRAFCLDYGARNGRELNFRMKDISEYRRQSAEHLENLRLSREAHDRARGKYFSARGVLDEALGRWGKVLPTSGDAEEFMNIFEGSVRDVLDNLKSLYEKRNSLLGAAQAYANTLSAFREEEIRALVPESRRAALAETTPEQIDEGIAYYRDQYSHFARLAEGLEAELNTLLSETEQPAPLSELLSATEAELNTLTDRYNAIDEALTALMGADIRLRAELTPKLAHYARELMSVMTDGKYDSMNVTDDLQLTVNQGGADRFVEVLSGGTRDIAYITLRLALIRLLYQETPPLCFDESFAHQDNDRCYAMLKVFSALAQKNGMQTFLLTCRGREYAVAKEMDADCKQIQLI